MEIRRPDGPLTFDEWARQIGARVSAAFPRVALKWEFDELYRWLYEGRECQLHAVGDALAAVIVLPSGRNGVPAWGVTKIVRVAQDTEDEVASRIIGYFSR